MDGRAQEDRGARAGGTLSLARAVAEHGGAIEYDLLTRAGRTLDDLGGGLTERALVAFVGHLPPDSAACAEILGDRGGWSRTDMLLARICEGIEELAWITACRGLKRSRWPRRPERIPRPGVRPDEGRRIGKDPIPISQFDSWYGGE